ncbi:MAG: tRNA-binding protein [Flavobacteriaceae bacterium]|nr:tRNA-binding protein [Flavobacteriaceae bacterium]
MITYQDFEKMDLRVGTILSAVPFEKARKPAYILEIDFGELGIKKSSAQITKLYNTFDLVGKQIIAVVNFPPKQVANIFSECLVLGVVGSEGEVVLIQPERKVDDGMKIG